MKRILPLCFLLLMLIGCSSSSEVQWNEANGKVEIRIPYGNFRVDIYYAEITLESGSKIAVELGKPNQEGKFRIKNTFGKFKNISVYTIVDLEGE